MEKAFFGLYFDSSYIVKVYILVVPKIIPNPFFPFYFEYRLYVSVRLMKNLFCV